jgi:hypothetical protein
VSREELREIADEVFRMARSEESPHRVTLDTERYLRLGEALYGKDDPRIVDLRSNINTVNQVADGEEITMDELQERIADFPIVGEND